jgi:hypothetical protein
MSAEPLESTDVLSGASALSWRVDGTSVDPHGKGDRTGASRTCGGG